MLQLLPFRKVGMPHRIRFVYFFIAFCLFSVLGVSVAAACHCARGSFNARWQAAEVIFRGTVKKIRVDHPRHLNAYDDKPVEITFDVAGYFKGGSGQRTAIPLEKPLRIAEKENQEKVIETGWHFVPEHEDKKTFTMFTSLQNLTCMGYPFKEGEDYLVFAYLREEGSGNRWSLYHYPSGTYGVGGLCGGTALYHSPESRRDLDQIHTVLNLSEGRGGGLINFSSNN